MCTRAHIPVKGLPPSKSPVFWCFLTSCVFSSLSWCSLISALARRSAVTFSSFFGRELLFFFHFCCFVSHLLTSFLLRESLDVVTSVRPRARKVATTGGGSFFDGTMTGQARACSPETAPSVRRATVTNQSRGKRWQFHEKLRRIHVCAHFQPNVLGSIRGAVAGVHPCHQEMKSHPRSRFALFLFLSLISFFIAISSVLFSYPIAK